GGYLFFGTVQSIVFFGFILTRLRIIVTQYLGSDVQFQHKLFVVVLTATLFSLFHIPNVALMACTFFAGICWAWIFYKRPNILLMGISHAILGTILHQVVQLHMRIGPFYENSDLYVLREVIPGLKKLIGDLF
ncbi:MAG: CPBP family glutamic-type intramembrane protease, partial [Balneolaceae bacterium]|nr:CPBP family glutamic-type intramembrane protease [Balneolaceae bacterium]